MILWPTCPPSISWPAKGRGPREWSQSSPASPGRITSPLVTGVTTAKTGVVGNSYFDRRTGKPVALIWDPVLDKDQTVKVPTVYDAAHEAGLKTASISWPATRNARTLDWTAPDMFGDGWDRFGTKSWLAELRGEGIPVDRQARWRTEATGEIMRDWLCTRMAVQVIQKHAAQFTVVAPSGDGSHPASHRAAFARGLLVRTL